MKKICFLNKKSDIFKKSLSLTLSILIIISIFTSGYAEFIKAKEEFFESKISEELYEHITITKTDEKIPIFLVFDDIDVKETYIEAAKETGYSLDEIQQLYDAIPSAPKSIFNLDNADYKSNWEEYLQKTKEQRNNLAQMHNKLIYNERKLFSKRYSDYNLRKLNEIKTDIECYYIGRFSPIVCAFATHLQIKELSRLSSVLNICYDEIETNETEYSYALPAVFGNYTRYTLGFDGYGVKIGVFDGGNPNIDNELSSSQINSLHTGQISTHTTTVIKIIAGSNGFAPNSTIYNTFQLNTTNKEEIENLLSCGVSIINYSMGISSRNSYYNDYEKWIDHVANNHKVTLVKSAGNDGVSSCVTIPGLAYNIITVGGTNTMATTSRSDDKLFDASTTYGSCGGNGGNNGCAKPDVVAPAYYYDISTTSYGTSYSAPTVTGIIAQMMEYDTTLKQKPAAVKAIISAGTDKKVLPGPNSSNESWATTLTAQQGAGQISAKMCISIIGQNNYITGTINSAIVTNTFSVSSSDSWIRYSLSWINNSSLSGTHASSSPNTVTLPNLKLQIFNPGGVSVGSSNFTNSSVELVHFLTNSTTGTFTSKISRIDSGTNAVSYAVAWY